MENSTELSSMAAELESLRAQNSAMEVQIEQIYDDAQKQEKENYITQLRQTLAEARDSYDQLRR